MEQTNLEQEFIALISKHRLLIVKICNIYSYDLFSRDDLFQEIVLQLWKAYPKFKGNAKFSTWLYRIALNTIFTDLRKNRPPIDLLGDAPFPERAIFNHQDDGLTSDLYLAISQLNETEKALVMLYLEDMTYTEMRDILGIPEGALKVRMSRIKEKLRQITKNHRYGTE